jgi:hypothetical protein
VDLLIKQKKTKKKKKSKKKQKKAKKSKKKQKKAKKTKTTKTTWRRHCVFSYHCKDLAQWLAEHRFCSFVVHF